MLLRLPPMITSRSNNRDGNGLALDCDYLRIGYLVASKLAESFQISSNGVGTLRPTMSVSSLETPIPQQVLESSALGL